MSSLVPDVELPVDSPVVVELALPVEPSLDDPDVGGSPVDPACAPVDSCVPVDPLVDVVGSDVVGDVVDPSAVDDVDDDTSVADTVVTEG